MRQHDSDGRVLRAGNRVQWERTDGGVDTGEYRCPLTANPDLAVVITHSRELVRVPASQMRVQLQDEDVDA